MIQNSLVQRLIQVFVLHIIMNYAMHYSKKYMHSSRYAPNQSKPELDESKYAHCVAYVNQLLHHEVNSAIPRLTTIVRWFLTNMFTLCSCYLRGFNFVFVIYRGIHILIYLVSCQSKEIPKYPNTSI